MNLFQHEHLAITIVYVLLISWMNTVWRKILTGENIDEFDEFSAIRQYFPYQKFPFS